MNNAQISKCSSSKKGNMCPRAAPALFGQWGQLPRCPRGSGAPAHLCISSRGHTWSSARTVRLLAKNNISLVNSYLPIFNYNTTYPHGDTISVYNLNDSVSWRPVRDLANLALGSGRASKGGFPVLARSSSQLAASACMSTFIQSQC